MTRWPLLASLFLAIAVGCGGGSSGDGDPIDDAEPTPTPSASDVATPSPTPTSTPSAAVGGLDPTFGRDGFSIVGERAETRVPHRGLRVMPDGSSEVIALKRPFPDHAGVQLLQIASDGVAVTRETPDAPIDAETAAFGADGAIWVGGVLNGLHTVSRLSRDPGEPIVDTRVAMAIVNDLVPLTDGGVLVVGSSNGRGRLRRLDGGGAIDRTFGLNGFVRDAFPQNVAETEYFAAAVGDDGRIFVIGSQLAAGFGIGPFVVAYDATGEPDPSFGDGGYVRLEGGVPTREFGVIAMASDGGVILSTSAEGLVRLDAAGRRDPGYTRRSAPAGIATALLVAPSGEASLAVLRSIPDAGVPGCDPASGFGCRRQEATLARLAPDGTPDPRFGDLGVFVAPNTSYSAIALVPPGRVLLAGSSHVTVDFAPVVLTAFVDEPD